MDINKILSEQLNLNALNPFATTNVEGVNDNAKNSEMSVNPDVAEVSDALNVQDEDATLSFDNIDLAKLNKSTTNINSMMNFMSNQVQNQENKEKQIEEEITKKQEEYQKLAEDIQEKQEEYESLVKQAESEQDQSIAEQATALGEEINSMVSNLESIKTSINNLESDLKTQENLTSTLKQTSQTMSKVQTQISKEVAQANAVSQTQATNQVSATDAVDKTDKVTQIVESVAYTKTETQKDGKVVTTSYGASGRPISATSTDKDGVVREISYKHNSDGSYTKTTFNPKTEAKTTNTYDANGNLTRKEKDYSWGDRQNRYDVSEIYEYNEDGSYSKSQIEKRYINGSKNPDTVSKKFGNYDSSGKILKGDPNAKVEEANAWQDSVKKVGKCTDGSENYKATENLNSYKDSVKEKGTTIVIFGNYSCANCANIKKKFDKAMQELDAAGINVVFASGVGVYAHPDIYEFADKFSMGKGLPNVVKFVDGKPVASLNNSNLKNDAEGLLAEIQEPYCNGTEYEQKLHTGQKIEADEIVEHLNTELSQRGFFENSHGNLWLATYDSIFNQLFDIIENHELNYDKTALENIKNFFAENADKKIDDVKSELYELWNNFLQNVTNGGK